MSYRIRTIAERAGMSPMTLRAWERRYGFPQPARTGSGYRTYTDEDLQAVLAVKEQIDSGLAASEAIELVRSGRAVARPLPSTLVEQFMTAAQAVSERDLERVSARAESGLDPVVFCREFALPALRRTALELDVAREHLASAVVRGHLRRAIERIQPLGAARGTFVLACPEGEAHEGGLLAAAVELRLRGARTVLLGADTPASAIGVVVTQIQPQAVGLSVIGPRAAADLQRVVGAVVRECKGVAVIVGGAGARRHLRAVYDAGAHFAETVDEFLTTVSERGVS